jgi:hypothetical protein
MALSLLIGSAGGALFFWLELPLAWMLGAMSATTLAALARAPVGFWMPLRNVMIMVIATLLGSAFTPEVAARVVGWGPSVVVVVAYVLAISALVGWYLIAVGGFDRVTSFFAATPGGLGPMALIGEAYGGDIRAISLTHATRILIVVCSIPLYLHFVEGLEIPASSRLPAGAAAAGPRELAILTVAAIVGAYGAVKLRIPNAAFLGPFALSVAAYYSGLVTGRPPLALVWGAQLVIGSALGARFVGVALADLRRVLGIAVGSGVLMLAGAILISKLAAPALGVDPHALLLALAPGGLPEMTLMGLALHIDTAFVSSMHIVRIVLVLVAAPFVFKLLCWQRPP